MQQESAKKEVKISHLTKMKKQDADDKEALNVALDAKQQELELVGRSHMTLQNRALIPTSFRLNADLVFAARVVPLLHHQKLAM